MGMVMVVDDNIDTCKVLSTLLHRAGHESHCVNTAREGIASIKRRRPDVVLLDLMMPEESGLDMLKELRADPATKELPVVIYSAVSEHRYVKQAMDSGATDYWLKGSIRGPDLQTRLAAYLPDVEGWAEPPASHPMA